VAWLYWRVDERLGAYTGGFGGGVDAVASLLDCEAAGGRWVRFGITVKEFAVPPPGQRLRFYAEADKAVNQKTAALVPCGWGNRCFCVGGLRAVDSAVSVRRHGLSTRV